MNERKLVKKFIEFESSNELFEFEINGIKVWDYIRVKIYNEIKIKVSNTRLTTKGDKDYPIKSLINGFISTIKSIQANKNILKRHDILFFNHPRRKKIKGLFVDIYSDYVIEEILNYQTVLSCESFFQMQYFKPAYTKKIYYLAFIEFFEIFSSFFFRKNLNNKEDYSIADIENKIHSLFGVDINLKKLIEKTISRYKYIYNGIDEIFFHVKPKVLICIDGYNITKKIAISIANKKGIPTIEMQHGTISNFHIGYNYPDEIQIDTFAKYFFSWGSYWSNRTLFPKGTIIKNVGFPFFEIEKERYSTIHKENKSVLVLSQGTIGRNLSDYTLKLSILLPDFTFYYKLHPSEIRSSNKVYNNLKKDNIVIISDNDIPLYELFAKCNIQIGVYSTAIAEGIGFGLRTVILKLYGFQTYSGINNSPNFLLSSCIMKIKKFILDKDATYNNDEIISSFFVSNSMKQISTELSAIFINERI